LRRFLAPVNRRPIQSARLRLQALEDRCVPANIVVNLAGEDPNPGHGSLSLREALAIANSNNRPDTITFGPGITTVSITNPAQLYALGEGQANSTVIDGGGVVTLRRTGTEDYGGVLTVISNSFVDLKNLTITGGHANYSGGGLWVDFGGDLTLDHVTVTGNTAGDAGGIFNEGVTRLLNSTVAENTATGSGGGIQNWGELILENSTIAFNSAAGNGGGVSTERGPIVDPPYPPEIPTPEFLAFNSTISGNSAGANCGGVFDSIASTVLTNVTIAFNRAYAADGGSGAGGGLFITVPFTRVQPTVKLNNTIVSANYHGNSATDGDDVSGAIDPTSSHNLIGGAALIGPLVDNGGPTLTHALLTGSPAINAGSDALAVDQNGVALTTDQRGAPRTVGGTVDIGAVESTIPPAPAEYIAVGEGPGGPPRVNVYDSVGHLAYSFLAYAPSFHGGVSVAVGDVNGDGVPDVITGAGPGGGPHVEVFDGTKLWMTQADGTLAPAAVIASFYAYDAGFRGGVNVAAGDVDGDGEADVVTGAGPGGGPHVEVFGYHPYIVVPDVETVGGSAPDAFQPMLRLASFFGYDPSFHGGVNVAVGDMTGDGKADVVTGAGPGGGPHVKVLDGPALFQPGSTAVANPLKSFFAYDAKFLGGVTVAVGDVNGDGHPDIVAGAGAGGGPHVKAFDFSTLYELASFFAYDPKFTGGVRVATALYKGSSAMGILTGPGPGAGPTVNIFTGAGAQVDSFTAFDPSFLGGVFVG
jgi:hypothetical protein